MHRRFLPLLTLLLALLTGCQSLGMPRLFGPGPASVQQARAVQFDPYPEDKIAPEIVGGRPQAYQNPPPETARARFNPFNWGRR
ncbi:MAG: membrane or secreted protein [Thermoguttaceae bacterium]|jgi:hypothetical protein